MEKTVCGYCRAIDGARVVFFEDGEADCDYPRCARGGLRYCGAACRIGRADGGENMKTEEAFCAQLAENLKKAAAQGAREQKRLLSACAEQTAPEQLHRQFSRRQCSDAFDDLADRGLLALSPEALVTTGRFGPLFSDEEANFCLENLLAAGFYG